MKKIYVTLATVLLSGCLANPTSVESTQADYGPKPTKELYEMKIKSYQEGRLKDPDSAKYNFSEPERGWCKFSGKVNFGWIIDYTLNAKNSYGGYVGAKPQFAFIKDNRGYHMHHMMRTNCGLS